ncbi:hypothetical protein GCM10023238_08190 [Streptomyces heliomycini]
MGAPVLEELREVCQPRAKMESRNGEHWAGRLYMRRISLRTTRHLVRTRSPPTSSPGPWWCAEWPPAPR